MKPNTEKAFVFYTRIVGDISADNSYRAVT